MKRLQQVNFEKFNSFYRLPVRSLLGVADGKRYTFCP